MRRFRLRNRLLISFVLLNLLSTAAATFTIYGDMRPEFLEAVEYTLIDTSRFVASELAAQAEHAPDHALNTGTLRAAAIKLLETRFPERNYYDHINRSTLHIYVTDAKGLVLFDSKGVVEGQDFSQWRDVKLSLEGKYGARATRADPEDPSTSTHFVSAPIMVQGKMAGVVAVGKAVESVSGFLRYSRLKILIIFILTALASVVMSAAAAYWIARPVLKLEAYVKSLSGGEPMPYPKLASDEIGSLGGAFETLRRELEGKSYVENYVHHLTHEIKSPITSILGAAELLSGELATSDRDQLLRNVRSEAQRLQSIAEKLLELASLEARDRRARPEEFDLKLMLDEVAESFEAQARALGVKIAVRASGAGIAHGERFLLWRALSNLVQNAIDFSPVEGTVAITAVQSGEHTTVAVADQGPGIPDYAKARVAERFFSLERPRTGKKSSGLGLSFVQEVMNLHGGRLEIDSQHGATAISLSW